MGPVFCRLMRFANHPNWNTATVMPRAAARESRLNSTPISGTRIDRNKNRSATNPRPTTIRRNHGSASLSTFVKSTVTAWKPPT